MNEYKVKFENPREVLEFTNCMSKYSWNMDMLKGNSTVVDAKSILGIIALGLGNTMCLRVYGDDCNIIEKDLQPYIA